METVILGKVIVGRVIVGRVIFGTAIVYSYCVCFTFIMTTPAL